MKVLITGVAGLLGSRMADWIINNTEYEVVGIDNLSGGYIENVNDKVIFYNRDISGDVQDIFKNTSLSMFFTSLHTQKDSVHL